MGWQCPSPGDLPDPGIEPTSLMSPALAGGVFTTHSTWEASANQRKSQSSLTRAAFPQRFQQCLLAAAVVSGSSGAQLRGFQLQQPRQPCSMPSGRVSFSTSLWPVSLSPCRPSCALSSLTRCHPVSLSPEPCSQLPHTLPVNS